MAYEGGALDATIAAACGGDEALYRELRGAFLESAERQLDLLRRARCDGNWRIAAMRLKGLASSFHDETLLTLADEAADAVPSEPTVLRRIGAHLKILALAI
jgi:hypothetical protein